MDTRASSNILYYHCFREMGLGDPLMKPTPMKLEVFTTHKITTKGTIVLNVTVGSWSTLRIEELHFYVLDNQSAYNAILGTPAQASSDMVVSVPHQHIQFLTPIGVGVMASNPRSMYNYLMQKKKPAWRMEEVLRPR